MITNTEKPVVFEGRPYAGIRELGFTKSGTFIVSLWPCPPPEPRGGYFTALPISSREYRHQHRTKTCFRDDGGTLIVFCDWGRPHRFAAERELLATLIADCRENGLDEVEKVSLATL